MNKTPCDPRSLAWSNCSFQATVILFRGRFPRQMLLSVLRSKNLAATDISIVLTCESKGLGNGQVGFQVALPVSKELSKQFITHWNVGTTVLPRVEGVAGNKTLNSPFAGASLIWLTKPNYNLMLEYLAAFPAELDHEGRVNHSTDQIVSPGFRFAINHGGLQVVPGVGVPVHFADGKTSTGIFLYLSFEHPF